MANKVRILYAEDNEKFRTLVIGELSQHNIITVGIANDGLEILEKIHLNADVILLDIEMPKLNGGEVLDKILVRMPSAKIILVSFYYEELLVADYSKRGAKGFICKNAFTGDFNLLANGIKVVHKGGLFFHTLPKTRKKLSTRQEQIVPMIVAGMTTKEIAVEIGLHERAIEKQKGKIYRKFGGNKAIDFFRYAFSKGLQFLGKVKR